MATRTYRATSHEMVIEAGMGRIAAERLTEHSERAGFVFMRRPPSVGAAELGCGHEVR